MNRFETSENLPIFIKEVNKYRALTREQEIELAQRIKDNPNDLDAIHRLVVANLKFVIKCANKFIGQNVLIDDLVSEGNLGLIDAAKRFDPTTNKNAKFITYAQFHIRKRLNHAIATQSKIVRLPMNQEYDIYKKKKNGEDVNTRTVQLDRPAHEGSDNTIGDTLLRVDPNVQFDQDHDRLRVNVLMSILTDEEKKVVEMKYGLTGEEEMTNKEIAAETSWLLNKVDQLLRSARTKIRAKHKTI